MSAPTIPDAILGVKRKLTASEASLYRIDCGPGGAWSGQRPYYKSGWPALAAYAFVTPSCTMDQDQLYTMTIYKEQDVPNTTNDPTANNSSGGKRRRRKTHRRRH